MSAGFGDDDTLAGEGDVDSPGAPGAGLFPGQVLAGRYHVQDRLGGGGMGEVFCARDRELDELVAIKLVRTEIAARTALIDHLRREVRLARRVAHRGVARVYELHEHEGARFVTMELVEGETLSSVLARKGPLSAGHVARVGAEIAFALSAAHEAGVVHRDIKPDNVMLRPDGRVAVMDFGIAFSRDDGDAKPSGTPAYMAPEQVRGEPAAPGADVYALGATLFHLLTGAFPFEGGHAVAMMVARLDQPPPDARTLRDDVPAGLASVLRTAMATQPNERFSDAGAMGRALEACMVRPVTMLEVRPRASGAEKGPTLALSSFIGAPEDGGLLDALREETLLRLGRVDGLRLLRGEDERNADFVAEVSRAGVADVRIVERRSSQVVFSGRIPLAEDQVQRLATLLVDGVALASGLQVQEVADGPPMRAGAAAPWLQARGIFRSVASMDYADAVTRYAQALRRSPGHPVLLAGHAMATLRAAFFGTVEVSSFDEVRTAVAQAQRDAPGRPEPHLAAGHLALHLDDPVVAARSFRGAVRAAPLWPDGHEWLGRMLIEAGFIVDGRARLEAAMDRNAALGALRWEVARAAALEGDWVETQAQLDALVRNGRSLGARLIGLLRLASYKDDAAWRDRLAADLDARAEAEVFDRPLAYAVLEAARGEWDAAKPVLLARAMSGAYLSRRRVVFYTQLACDAAAQHGDVDSAFACLRRGIEHGLFDLHWLERSPHLAPLRDDARYADLHGVVRARTMAVHDALYDAG
ncbi:MAG: serine/threonine-protein kinase [Myxococcota bacterium]